jgi:hypothetical protein
MTDLHTAAQLALEALEDARDNHNVHYVNEIVDLRQAIEQAEQAQPVAITEQMAFAFHNAITDGAIGADDLMDIMRGLEAAFAHITAPPPRQPLTEEEMADYLGDRYHDMTENELEFFRLGEAAHGIKENT